MHVYVCSKVRLKAITCRLRFLLFSRNKINSHCHQEANMNDKAKPFSKIQQEVWQRRQNNNLLALNPKLI